jgi:hypothetical protein
MQQDLPQRMLGILIAILSAMGFVALIYFYGFVLFSDQYPSLREIYTGFRILFTIPSGILVIYAAFFAVMMPLLIGFLIGMRLATGKRYITARSALALLLVWGIAVSLASAIIIGQAQEIVQRINPFSNDPVPFPVEREIPVETRYVFRTTLRNEVDKQIGRPIEGYEPFMFLQVFPGLTETDFEGVEASIGHYTVADGRLVHKLDDTRLVHSAAKAVTDRGMDTLLGNISKRLKVDLSSEGTLTEIMNALVRTQEKPSSSTPATDPSPAPAAPQMHACTMEAKICPDGSAVGRQGPNCEFAPCPGS